ncbi:lactate racemase domain-containing protein [Candidatus Poribacteria bacterium]
MWINKGGTDVVVKSKDKKKMLTEALQKRGGSCSKILVIPPDVTRLHSGAGELTQMLYEMLGKDNTFHIMPAIGTHEPLTEAQMDLMYTGVPHDLFKLHDWRNDVVELGVVPSEFVKEVSEGTVDLDIPIQVNKILLEGGYDLIISVGQVVPHENTGMANHNKNIFVGVGGQETINKGHFLAGVYGMERIMGRIKTPLRQVLDYAEDNFLNEFEIVYVLTVMGRDETDELVTRGLYIGDDRETFEHAAKLSQKVNITRVDKPQEKMVVYLDPKEYQSHWLGNKSIYRTRMAMADDGELVVIAPGLHEYGEDPEMDRLIRKYGYHGTEEILREVNENQDLRNNLAAAAHLIHGSSEGRFNVTYAPGHLTPEETKNAGYQWADVNSLLAEYDVTRLKDGYNDGFYYISNPAVGLWMLETAG